jgi:hypothetical protein
MKEGIRMYASDNRIWVLISIVAVVASCSGHPIPKPATTHRSPLNMEEAKNQELSYGYGQLYRTVSGLKHVDKILYVKVESSKVGALIEDISGYAKHVAEQLERLDHQYPSLSTHDSGLPTLERKRCSDRMGPNLYHGAGSG